MTRFGGTSRFGALLVGMVALGLLAGCAEAPPVNPPSSGPGQSPPARSALPQGGCPGAVSDPVAAQRALDAARPGDRICVTGAKLAGAELAVHRSGAPGAPIQLLADGAEVRGITVQASQVVVAGFTIRGGDGLNLNGAGLTAHDNSVLGARLDGISCECSDAVIESNRVDGTDGTGIMVIGTRITVRGNTVSGSVRKKASDADGMRFFGTAIRISRNTVRDISEQGYPADDAPHTDCFQTYDAGSPPTYDVVISDNTCERVDVQCLIATAEHGNPGVPAGVRAIIFRNNTCAVGGSQAINLDGYPHVDVIGNTISGANLYRGVYLANGATDATVTGNVVRGPHDVFEADESSEPVRATDNRNQS